MKTKRNILLFSILLLYPLLHAQQENHVLFISSYHSGFPSFFHQVDGLREVFSDQNISLDIQFMDMKRFPDDNNLERFSQNLSDHLSRLNLYDLLIVGDDYAFNFALLEQHGLLQNIPIVFLGVNNIEKALAQDSNPRMTGVIEHVSMKETIEAILSLHQNTENIVAIVDGTESGKGDLQTFIQLKNYFNLVNLKTIDLSTQSWSEFKLNLNTLSKDSILLLLSAYSDKNLSSKSFEDSLELISSSTVLPIYHLWQHGIGKGLVGGKIISHYNQGIEAGKLALQILSGFKIEELPVIKESPNNFLFDYEQLKRYGINQNKLPENSEVLNLPFSFFREYFRVIAYISAAFTALLVLIAFLIFNILRRRAAEQFLQMVETAIDQSPISVLITDSSGSIIYGNNYLCEMTGYTKRELIGQNPRIFQDRTNNLVNFEQLWESISEGHEWKGILHNLKKNRDPYIEQALIKPVLDKKNTIQSYIAVKEDITDKIKQEQMNKMLLTAIEHIDDVVEVLDRNRKLIYINPSFAKRYGYSSDEVLGLDPLELFDDRSHDNSQTYDDLWNVVNSRETWRGQFTNKTKEGIFIVEDVSISPIIDNEDKIYSYVSVKKDITDFLKLIEERDLIKEDFFQNQRLESIGHLTMGIAHDYNNVLSGIMSASQLLLKHLPEKEIKCRKYGKMIFTNCERAAQLTKQLSTFSQKRTGVVQFLNFSDVILEVLDLLQHTIKKSIQFSFNNHSLNPKIYIERNSIQSVLLNLAINASNAVEEDGEIRFTLKDREINDEYCSSTTFNIEPGKYICLSIQDNGCGISQENLQKIFVQFYTTQKEGTGLGLPTVKRIVEENNGAIEVESQLGYGTLFTVLLPVLNS